MEILNDPKHWNTVSTGYADFIQPIFEGFFSKHIDRLALRPDMRVLDLACGPGTVSLQIFDQVNRIDGLDFSKDMIDVLEESIKQRDIKNIQPHLGDGQDLSRFDDNSFDLVISLFGLIFFPDRAKALAEVKRVLKPEGRAFITSWPPMAESSFMTTLGDAIQSTGCLPKKDENPQQDTGTPDPEVFMSEFREANFLNIKKESAKIEVAIGDVDLFWQQNVKGSMPILMIKEDLSEEKWKEFNEKALAYLKQNLSIPCSLEFQVWIWSV